MGKYRDTDYIHISTRVRALENGLFGKDIFEKIIDAPNAEEALKILVDNGYEAPDATINSPEDFELLLENERSRVYNFLADNVHNKTLIDIFRLPYDYMNIKALLKSEYLNRNPENMLSAGGTISISEMKIAVRERDRSVLSKKMYTALTQSLEAFAKTFDPQQTDLICDRACYEELLEVSEKSEFDFLYKYITTKVDLLNISAFVRLKNIKKNFAFYEKVYIPSKNGLRLSFFSDMYEQPLLQFSENLQKTAYADLGENFVGTEPITSIQIEKSIEKFFIDLINKFKYIPFGPELPISFLLAKDSEIKNVRIAMSVKISGLSSERVRERLDLNYV